MTINFKLDGIPPIYYFNLDHRKERKEYIENQFIKYGISDYTRVPSSRYSVENYNEWKPNVIIDRLRTEKHLLATTIDRIHGIIDWYNSGVSETCLVIEDDLCFGNIKNWDFDWKTLMTYIPCNWECVQFHIIGAKFVQMNLSKWTRNNNSTACIMINRSYAEKLIKLHRFNNKFILHSNYGYSNNVPEYHYQSVDFILFQIGITYSIPIFVSNSSFESDGYRNGGVNFMARDCDKIVTDWWENKSCNYSFEEIFYLDTPKRKELIFPIKYDFSELTKKT